LGKYPNVKEIPGFTNEEFTRRKATLLLRKKNDWGK